MWGESLLPLLINVSIITIIISTKSIYYYNIVVADSVVMGANVAASRGGPLFSPVCRDHAHTSSDADANAAPRHWLAASLWPLPPIIVSLDPWRLLSRRTLEIVYPSPVKHPLTVLLKMSFRIGHSAFDDSRRSGVGITWSGVRSGIYLSFAAETGFFDLVDRHRVGFFCWGCPSEAFCLSDNVASYTHVETFAKKKKNILFIWMYLCVLLLKQLRSIRLQFTEVSRLVRWLTPHSRNHHCPHNCPISWCQ